LESPEPNLRVSSAGNGNLLLHLLRPALQIHCPRRRGPRGVLISPAPTETPPVNPGFLRGGVSPLSLSVHATSLLVAGNLHFGAAAIASGPEAAVAKTATSAPAAATNTPFNIVISPRVFPGLWLSRLCVDRFTRRYEAKPAVASTTAFCRRTFRAKPS